MSKKQQEISFEYSGKKIVLTDHDKKFRVVDTERHYDTFKQATDAIDRATAAERKVVRVKLALACINGDGKPVVVTGINSGNGILLLDPRPDIFRDSNDLFPDTPAVKDLLAHREALRRQVELANSVLSELRVPRGYSSSSRGYRPENYPEDIAQYVKGYNAVRAKAEKTTMAEMLEKHK